MDDSETFDTWRKAKCLEAVGKPGITACDHHDFRPLLAHFQTLAGDDSSAFISLMRSGKPTDHATPGDTIEEREAIVASLAAHMHLATAETITLLAEAMEFNAYFQPGIQWKESPARIAFRKMLARKAAIKAKAKAKGKGPLTVGYVVYLTRQKTRRPDLTLGKDW